MTGPRPLRVALVSMPFASYRRPSLQLGLLAAIVRSSGHRARALHLNLDFAALLGVGPFDLLCEHRGLALGDWLFAEAAFGEQAPDPGRVLPEKMAPELQAAFESWVGPGQTRAYLAGIRSDVAGAFIRRVAGQPEWAGVDVVGFSSTFQQNVASLALARALKEQHPGLVTVFGGANVDGEMGEELVAAFPCIDLALQGEADESLPLLLDRLAAGDPVDDVPGLLRRGPAGPVRGPAPRMTTRLDALPVPDYDDYFSRAERLELLRTAARRDVDLPMETARGCWWGERRHCTFCGLNGQTMTFRAKSPDRVLAELEQQALRYRSFRFEAVDNILDPSYLQTLLPRIIDSGATYDIFYEVKANLTREDLLLLRRAGVRRIQPGIESLSPHVLRLMRKGVRAGDNVNLLRWAAVAGIAVSWNLIWGFPEETATDYAEQSALIPQLVHLPPPGGAGPLWLERFSPLFTDQEQFPAASRRPEQSLSSIYPARVDLARVAYFFDAELLNTPPAETYDDVAAAVAAWQARHRGGGPVPQLRYFASPGLVQVVDGRHPDQQRTHTLTGVAARAYLACSPRPFSARALTRDGQVDGVETAVRPVLDRLVADRLMMRDGDRYLSLALPAGAGPLRPPS